ncbi:MAG: MFS transporter [Lachnospiraceae bacterium]|nr:MFS transporter [Lachnospiraceae bacterium]
MNNKKPLNSALKTFFGLGDCLFDFHSSYKTYYWSFYLTSVAALPLAVVAIINSVVNTCEIIMSFLYGALMDSLKPMKWGRYRSIVLVLAPFTAIFGLSQWLAAGLIKDSNVAMVAVIACSLIYAVFFNMQYSANATMITVCGATEKDRAFLSSRRWAWINADKIVISAIVTFMIARFTGVFGDSAVMPYILVGVIFAVLCVLGQYIIFKISDGYEETEEAGSAAAPKKGASFKDIVNTITKTPPLLALFCAQCGTTTVSFILAQMAAYQFNYALEAPAMLAIYLAATNFGAVIGSLLAGILGRRMEAKRLSQCLLPLCIIFLILARVFSGSVLLFTIFILCERTCSNCNFSTFLTMYSNCAIYAEHKTGVNNSGLVMSISNIPVKVAVLITGVLIPTVLAVTGYEAGMEVIPQAVKTGLTNAITLIPSGCYLFAVLVITFAFRLSSADVARMTEEIAERKKNA